MTCTLRITTSQHVFWHRHKNESAVQPGHEPSIRTNDNRMGQCLLNTAEEVGLAI